MGFFYLALGPIIGLFEFSSPSLFLFVLDILGRNIFGFVTNLKIKQKDFTTVGLFQV